MYSLTASGDRTGRREVIRGALAAAGAALVSPAVAPAQQIPLGWPSGAKAAVSLTYDDGLNSQLDNVVPALARFGLSATFFLTKVNIEPRVVDWRRVGEAGHEMGNHTVHHLCRLGSVSPTEFDRQEIEDMEAYLAANFDKGRVPIFAYPCGVLGIGRDTEMKEQLRYVRLLKERFIAARAAVGAPNDPRLVPERRYVLQATAPTYYRDDPQLAIDYVRSAMRDGRWAILIFHNVLGARHGDGDTSIRSHETILRWLTTQPIWCVPMGQVLARLGINRASPGLVE